MSMRRNVASQNIAAQMNARSDGSPLTTGVSVFYTGDGGTQTSGGGTLTHKGNGHWNYAPATGETNFAHVAFTFVHATGVNVTINVYPVSYNPGDSVRLGLTALPNAAAEAAGGLYTRGTGPGQINQPADGRVDTNVVAVAGTTQTARDLGGQLDAAVSTRSSHSAADIWAVGTRTLTSLGSSLVAEIWNALTSGMTTAGSIGKKLADWVLGSDNRVLLSADAQTGVTIPTVTGVTNPVTAGTVSDKTGYSISGTKQTLDALQDLSAAQVNSEVVDALNVDTYAEPGQGTPPATATLAAKINYLFKGWRNRRTQTSTQFSLYNDAEDTVDQKATFSDDGSTAIRGEMATGP